MLADGFWAGFMAGMVLLSLYWLNGNTYFTLKAAHKAFAGVKRKTQDG